MRSIKEMSSLQGRTALVTGGAGYLGVGGIGQENGIFGCGQFG